VYLLPRAPAHLATRSHLGGDCDRPGHDSLPLAGLPGRRSLPVDGINLVSFQSSEAKLRNRLFARALPHGRASDSNSINCSATTLRAAVATLGVRMQCLFVVDGDFFAGMNIPQGKEQYVAVQILHVSVRLATVVDVMRAVATAGAVQTATAIDVADAEDSAVATALRSFEIRDAFARVLRDFLSARKKRGSKATSAINRRRFDRETGREVNLHHSHFTTDRLLESGLRLSPCRRERFPECTGLLRLWLCHADARQVSDLPARSTQDSGGL
jgi:hypothetical protein